MPDTTTIGKVLFNRALPEKYRDEGRELDKKSLSALLSSVAEDDPDGYIDTLQKVSDVSRMAVNDYGRTASLSLNDLKLPPAIKQLRNKYRDDVARIANSPTLTSDQKGEKIVKLLVPEMKKVQNLLLRSGGGKNSFTEQVRVGARGNTAQLMQLMFGDMLVLDHKNKPVPIPGLHGYGEGVSPIEYWAASYGSRKGYSDVQFATADSGYFGKQLTQAAHRVVVTENDCGAQEVGLEVDGDDSDNVGSILAKPVNGLPAGTEINKEHLPLLEDQPVYVRSAATCQAATGICSKCSGRREGGEFPDIGDAVGVTAARAIAEPTTQAGLCLEENTLVRMADGSVRKIKDIQVGESVMGSDVQCNTSPVKVLNVFNNGIKECYHTIFASLDVKFSEYLIATKEHKVLGFPMGDCELNKHKIIPLLSLGTAIFKRSGENVLGWMSYCEGLREVQTYDLEVDSRDHLFVLANGMIVSNSSKHSGGVVGEDDKKVTGFKEIDQFVQVPKNFIGSATLASTDGSIGKIEDAPQGGWYVHINSEEHYVPGDRKLEVKTGQRMEAGDALSSGVPNPGEVVKYKGIGEGRRYFTERYNKILKDNGAGNHRRNIEAISRGFINRVRVTDPNGYEGHFINDVIPYDDVVRDYRPRPTSTLQNPKQSVGMYLEKPVLHYSIGTKITANVAKKLSSAKTGNIVVHRDVPPFEPFVSRVRDIVSTDPDWVTRLGGFDLKKSFLDAAQKGATSEGGGTSYIPSVVSGQELYKNIKDKRK